VSKKAVDSLGLIIAGGTTRDDQVSVSESQSECGCECGWWRDDCLCFCCFVMLSRGLRGEDRSAEQNKCCQQYNRIDRDRTEHNTIEYNGIESYRIGTN
jgi:hypothetical protein